MIADSPGSMYDTPSAITSASSSNFGTSQQAAVDNQKPSSGQPGKGHECPPTACIPCRRKHLKCDRGFPCIRCAKTGSECTYVASRRGVNRPTDAVSVKRGVGDALGLLSPSWASAGPFPGASSLLTLYRPVRDPSQQTVDATMAQRCLHSFYCAFHLAHPFVVPEKFLFLLAGQPSLEPLLASMRWVGSLYLAVNHGVRATLFSDAIAGVYGSGSGAAATATAPRDALLLQAMMVLLVGLDGMCESDMARRILGDASLIATELSAHTRSFASAHGQGIPVLEESLRRTWWDLYVIDSMIAGMHRASSFALFDLDTNADLPCEEWQYMSGNIPVAPTSLSSLEARDFSDSAPLSSFAYRVLCARNLGRFLRLSPSPGPGDEDLAQLEASLTNWRLHLPPAKRDAVGINGSSDEMMFQAQMMLHATSILLHHPHSEIDSVAARNVDACTSIPGEGVGGDTAVMMRGPAVDAHGASSSGGLYNTHTRHVITAADEIGKLITHRAPIRSHTPFFTCVIVLGSVVQLNRWGSQGRMTMPLEDGDGTDCIDGGGRDQETRLRDQVRLGIGALTHMAEVWKSAATALGQVRGVARELHQAKQQGRRRQGQQDEADAMRFCLTMEDIFGDDSLMATIGSGGAMPDP
ncbi:Fungal Zn(2)-Cys(6) binuclear cluster domain [Geosmithia morbida]|uniref:Fungal Zn(2)-Cys(6) binuclear cluster domain n=1 Tax=Geosmithia morbida TaxID=1094350 RepID=A0A9P4YVW0_9HYPO|nr:Fungal Zn(2)-Cys(6) binuclear cluster domain [Geosmithia morbida]KAF4122767.1 Fungal Zn(2)-Cys(6) binuclear cluster domain [Geosmithia morbida]